MAHVATQIRQDATSTAGFIYVGKSKSGNLASDKSWSISRQEMDGNDLVCLQWANGTDDAVHSWTDRLTYTYS